MNGKTLEWNNRSLWRLAWPMLVELLLAVAVGMADTVMVASVSEAAVSGVSLVDAISNLLIFLISALATGGAVVISQYIGRRDRQNASTAAKQLLYSVTALTLCLMVLALVFRRALLVLIYGALEPDVMEAGETYLLLAAISYPFLGLYNAGAAIFRSQGNSRVSMFVSLGMNLINIGGNAVLIYGLGWGVAGAGTATLVSRIFAAAVVVYLASRLREGLDMRGLAKIKLKPDFVKMILRVGLPNGLENSMFHIGKLLTGRIIAGFGTAAIAANAVAGNFLGIGNVPGQAIGLTLLTVVGQCVGAGDIKLARRLGRKLMWLCHALMGAMALLLYLLMDPAFSLFALSAEAIAIARQCAIVYCVSVMFLWPQSFSLPNALRAAGDVRFTMFVSIFSMWVFRIGASYLLAFPFGLGVLGVWIAMVVDWVFRGTMFLLRWRGTKWEGKKVLD